MTIVITNFSIKTFIFVSFTPLLSSLHVHNPGLYSLDLSGEYSRLARFQLKRNPFAVRSAEIGPNSSTHYPHNLCSSSEGCIVLGSSGSGKTALRISIENELSKENKRPLVVSLTEPQQLDHFIIEFKSKFPQDSFVLKYLLILFKNFFGCILFSKSVRTGRNQRYKARTQKSVAVSIAQPRSCCGRPRILQIACLRVLFRN